MLPFSTGALPFWINVHTHPGAVEQARAQQVLRALMSDARDLGAMAELLTRGAGRLPEQRDEDLAAQVAWTAHRRRKVKARTLLTNQVSSGNSTSSSPGPQGCFTTGVLTTRPSRVILRDLVEPARVERLGEEGLRSVITRKGLRMTRPKAVTVTAACNALRLPDEELAATSAVFGADVVLLDALNAMIDEVDLQCRRCSATRRQPSSPPYRVSRSFGHRTTAQRSATRGALPVPSPPITSPASCPHPTNLRERAVLASTPHERARSSSRGHRARQRALPVRSGVRLP